MRPAGARHTVGPVSRYSEAFARNIGLLTPAQQHRLQTSRVAIAGCGGGGGGYAAALARAGVGRFTLADPDDFELVNLNRQFGARLDTLGRNKAEVTAEIVGGIVPDVDVRVLPVAIDPTTIDAFLDDVDVVCDALDFFAPDARRLVFREARARGIPVITGGPLLWSAAWTIWLPDGPSLEQFCGFRPGMSRDEVLTRFVVAAAPGGTHVRYADTTTIDFDTHEAPSLGPICTMLHGIVASEVVNLLTGVRPVRGVPFYAQFDMRTLQFKTGQARWGNDGPIQRVKTAYVTRRLGQGARERAKTG